MSNKAAIRAAVLAARRALPASARDAADRALVAAAADLVRGARNVAAYTPMPGEPGGSGLMEGLAAVVGSLLLPVLRPDCDLDWARYDGPFCMAAAPDDGSTRVTALREPAGSRLGPDAVGRCDAVLLPALAVDRAGTRLGRGGGSFDRALARVRPGTPVVALLYEGELRHVLPAESHDRPVTAALMPSGLRRLPLTRHWTIGS